LEAVEPRSAEKPYQVICVCGGYGFPLGNASAARITAIAKTLQLAGLRFLLLHCGPSPDAINTQGAGVYDGVPFEYTTPVRRPKNPLARWLRYLGGVANLSFRLYRLKAVRRQTLVYLYVMDGPLNLYVGILCKLLGIPVVQELCEWLPGEPTCSRFTLWLYRKPIFALASGALVISKAIEQRVQAITSDFKPGLRIHRLPSIVDSARFSGPAEVQQSRPAVPEFVYCGTWLGDIYFLIRATALVRQDRFACRLKIVGSCSEQSGPAIRNYAWEQGLSEDDLIMTGCVDDRALEDSYRSATALLLPLWDDDRSRTRLPNKLSEYLASGRPVITCNIGDLTDLLDHGVSALIGRPGSDRDFADQMVSILRDPERAARIGQSGQQVCISSLDYRAHAQSLAEFFVKCLEPRQ
jgi:glycosyltransferase involved in cell wall biosynthesis